MLLAMAEDVRVVFIKLADRLHNMRTLDSLSEEKQKRIARETMDIFAPLANRLGIWQMKWELEDLAFQYLEPAEYKRIAGFLAERREDRAAYIDRFVATLARELRQAEVAAEVTGRPKHIYSIWRKMQKKGRDFERIFDVRAVRVLVNDIRDCYTALGVVHSLWQHIPGEFDDYIATPKENHYRSIHTAVIGPDGKTVEVQIRTHDMHNQSELGVAVARLAVTAPRLPAHLQGAHPGEPLVPRAESGDEHRRGTRRAGAGVPPSGYRRRELREAREP